MSTTTLYLVRHGVAEADTSTDPGLTPEGLRQADAAGHALRETKVDIVFHSSRRRAVETARAIASSLGARTEISDLLEDRTPIPDDWSSIPKRYHDFLHHVPDDEADLGARDLTLAVQYLSEVGQDDQTIVAVTHNFVIGWFVRTVLDAPRWRWIGLDQGNGAITTIRWSHDREPLLLTFNKRGHLARADLATRSDDIASITIRQREIGTDALGRPLQIASGQTTSTETELAWAASASMSARSPVSTVPPGSAIATTSASTAEPARARRRSSAARRAVNSLTVGSMMHIFKNRWVLASRLGSP